MTQKPLVLVTDDVHSMLLEGLQQLGFKVDYKPNMPYQEVFSLVHQYSGIVINSKMKMTKELMGLAPKMQFIARLGSGLEIIDLIAAKELGISVFSAPEGNRNAVAEHALGQLLALANNLVLADGEVRNREWNREKMRGWELEGKTVGIIGFGNNGSAFAKKLSGFDVQVLAYDKYNVDYARDYSFVEECTSIDRLQDICDVISLHVPLDDSTHYLVDSEFVKKCKDGVIIINSARGKVVDTEALISGLSSGKIGGACLDVFENEKPFTFTDNESLMYQKLYDFDQVILSPHVAGWTVESKYKIASSLLGQISNLATGH